MENKDFWRMGMVLLTAAMFLTSGFGQAWAGRGHYKLEWEKLEKELNLTPQKAGEFQAVGAKYTETRKDLIAKLKKDEADLEIAVTGPKPDEARIKELVPMIIADHNQLFESFKAQRQEEMALLTPLQQAKYLLALRKWHEENRGKGKTAK